MRIRLARLLAAILAVTMGSTACDGFSAERKVDFSAVGALPPGIEVLETFEESGSSGDIGAGVLAVVHAKDGRSLREILDAFEAGFRGRGWSVRRHAPDRLSAHTPDDVEILITSLEFSIEAYAAGQSRPDLQEALKRYLPMASRVAVLEALPNNP